MFARSKRITHFALKGVFTLLLIAGLLTTASVSVAYAVGGCDGTPGADNIVCSTNTGDPIGLDADNDTFTLTDGTTVGDVNGDSDPTGATLLGSGGVDQIIINGDTTGTVSGDKVSGTGGGDTITIGDTGSVGGSVAGDYSDGNGGNDNIAVEGDVSGNVLGDYTASDGGADTITIEATGTVDGDILGDDADGNGGADTITVNGEVGGIVLGDGVAGDGADDVITVNGSAGAVNGDGTGGNGGNDTININGTVDLDVNGEGGNDVITLGDGAFVGGGIYTAMGNDTVTIGDGAELDEVYTGSGNDTLTIGDGAHLPGAINGDPGWDILRFTFMTQGALAGLDPAGDTLTYGGETYTWTNFEELIGLLAEIAANGGAVEEFRIVYQANQMLGIADGDGITVMGENGRIAYVPYSAMEELEESGPQIFQAPNSNGWYVRVSELGANPNNPANDIYLVEIFDAAGVLQGEFTFNY